MIALQKEMVCKLSKLLPSVVFLDCSTLVYDWNSLLNIYSAFLIAIATKKVYQDHI